MTRKTHAQSLASLKPDPTRYASMSREQIEAALSEISDLMKGPMTDLERALTHGDRLDLRAALAALPH